MEQSPPPGDSDEDFYGNDTPKRTMEDSNAFASLPKPDTNAAGLDQDPAPDADVDDSSSDMDISSHASTSPPASPKPTPLPLPKPESRQIGVKRGIADVEEATNPLSESADRASQRPRMSESSSTADAVTLNSARSTATASIPAATNGTRLAPDTPPAKGILQNMPGAILQRIFGELPPAGLARVMSLHKRFHAVLTKGKASLARVDAGIAKPAGKGIAVLQDGERIWSHARTKTYKTMPRPLQDTKELEMLQLLGRVTCEVCGTTTQQAPPSTSANDRGPGPGAVRVIFPFGIRTCGPCLFEHTLPDVQLMQQEGGGKLRLGLPHIFLTPDYHYVPGPRPTTSVTKRYLDFHFETLKDEAAEARAFGEGVYDEWVKGLQTKGNHRVNDAAKWEEWERQHVPRADQVARVLKTLDTVSFPKYNESLQGRLNGAAALPQRPAVKAGMDVMMQSQQAYHDGYGLPAPLPMPHMNQQNYGMPAYGFQMPPHGQQPYQAPKPRRSAEEVEAIREGRKFEIERRCQQLDPPIAPELLSYMESYRNAMQVSLPMTDAAWVTLAPKLLAQMESAKEEYLAAKAEEEYQKVQQMAYLEVSAPSMPQVNPYAKYTKEVDHAYERRQEPLRKRLAKYADEYFTANSDPQEKDDCFFFASGCLQYIQQRYEEDQKIKDEAEGHVARSSSPGKPFLSLDNMKWVWDNKIREKTESLCPQPFFCADCPPEANPYAHPKQFAFEGMMQHYGAVHTDDFRVDNVHVVWATAAWPEVPPFATTFPHIQNRAPRRTSGYHYRGGGRGGSTAYSQHTPYAPPARGVDLSQYPAFSAQPQQDPYQQYSHAATGWPTYPNGFAQQVAVPSPEVNQEAQVDEMVAEMSEAWDQTKDVRDLCSSIRVKTALHHGIAKVEQNINQKPDLDLLTAALLVPTLQPLKTAGQLVCKLCVSNFVPTDGHEPLYYERMVNSKNYTLSGLINHFKISHLPQDPSLDWTTDMIDLPENEIVGKLLTTAGMDDTKLALIAAAFPGAFPTPLPMINAISTMETTSSVLASNLLSRLNKPKSQPKKKKGRNGMTSTPAREDSQPPLAAEDQYDPRRPAFVDPLPDLSRFDSDAARPSSAIAPRRISLQETLAALSGQHRSPSVGAPEPQPPIDVSKLDIAGILASLAPQQPVQVAQPQSHYGDAAALNLSAVLARNAQQYQQNAAYAPQTYVAPPPAVYQQPSPAYQQPQGYYPGGRQEEVIYVNEKGERIYPVQY